MRFCSEPRTVDQGGDFDVDTLGPQIVGRLLHVVAQGNYAVAQMFSLWTQFGGLRVIGNREKGCDVFIVVVGSTRLTG